ncbi:MAG: NAD(P)/FAD-dependent oxidoreductase, partial [Clostridiales bacterium]|nr:NAD(P)/FAD-dependent oxidoreductase [Clostridiales bacterium]
PAAVDLQRVYEYKNNIVSKLTSNIVRMLRNCRVRVEAGEARLQSAHEIHCRGRNYSTAKVVLCGGTKVGMPDIPGLGHSGVCSTNGLFSITNVPPRMLVLGGGSAGCEIAAAFAAFGSNVMLVEPQSRILPDMDAQVAEAIDNALTGAGVKIHAGIAVREVADRDGYPFVITERGGVLCDKVVVTTDREADTSFLGSLANAIAFRNGYVLVNEYLETSVPGIFAAGDITGLGTKTHAAYLMAECAASNALGGKRPIDLRVVPKIVYTSPQAASVGLSEEDAREKYRGELLTGYCPLSENARAMLSGTTEGFVKVLAGKRYGEIYGVHIVGAEAAEMIAEPAALMRMEVTVHEAAGDIVHAHPSYAEAFMEACSDALGRSIHLMKAEILQDAR